MNSKKIEIIVASNNHNGCGIYDIGLQRGNGQFGCKV